MSYAHTLKNTCFIDALWNAKTATKTSKTRIPVWLMRQAGRYLPEYRQTRQRAGHFMALAQNPDFATEVTLQPLARYDLDAAILFSDILTIPDAMGLGLEFVAGEGPIFHHPLQTEQQIRALQVAPMDKLTYVFDAVRSICRALSSDGVQTLPLIGFSGSPWTLACYMVEGKGSQNDFIHAKTLLYSQPALMEHILECNTQSVMAYLDAQIQAGCHAVMLFDSWGGLLNAQDYQRYSWRYLRMISTFLHEKHPSIPQIIFTKGGGTWLSTMLDAPAQALGLDWTVDLAWAHQQTKGQKTLQGNLDPMTLLGSPGEIIKKTHAMLSSYQSVRPDMGGYIANLGHGILQTTPPENVGVLVDAIRAFA